MRRYGKLLSEPVPDMLSMGRFAVVIGTLLGLVACKTPAGMTGRAFHFPERSIRSSRPGKLADETRVRQIVTINYRGQKYLLWYATPGTIHQRTAIANRLSSMQCELSSPEIEQGFENIEKPRFPHSTFSVCRW